MKTAEMFKILAEITGQGRILTVPRLFVEKTGGHVAAILLSQALYWYTTQADAEGWVKKSDADIANELLIKRDQLVEIREVLKPFGLVHARRGLPASSHYKVDIDQFFKAFGAADDVLDSIIPPKVSTQTSSGFSPKQDQGKTPNLTPEISVPDGVSATPSFISNNTLEKNGGVSTGDLLGGQTARGESPQQQKRLVLETMQVYDKVFEALPAPLRIKLTEVQRLSKRPDTQFRAWVREFVAPEMQRLGSGFPAAVEAACKAAVLANPAYCLADFVKSISSAQPARGSSKTPVKPQEAQDDPLQALIKAVFDE